MHVQDVERFFFEDFQHFDGEGERVGGVVEEWVLDDLGLMEVDAGIAGVHADGRGIGDEMHVVAAGSEFLPEFGGDDARAAVGGVACDANTHV